VRNWYEQERTGLGGEFLDEFAAAMRALELNPERERLYYRNFRRVIFRRFPCKLTVTSERKPGTPKRIPKAAGGNTTTRTSSPATKRASTSSG
jgi:hypothetical protein